MSQPTGVIAPARPNNPSRAAATRPWTDAAARGLRDLQRSWRLANLRRWAKRQPRYTAGTTRLSGLTLCYDDALSLYMEYKHIFDWGVYDFRPQSPAPRVLDCGAHIGLSALRFLRLAPGARVTCFEPDPRVVPLLRQNLRQNADGRAVEVVTAALAAKRGKAAFVDDGADGGALSPHTDSAAHAQTVATVRLSDYLNQPVDFLKMNIEGAELDVLREAAPKLHNVRQLVVEYHGFPQPGQVLHELLELLHQCGFRYSLHHFDYETNPAVKPPFRVHANTRFFLLVAATQLWESKRCEEARGSHEPIAESEPRRGGSLGLPELRPVISAATSGGVPISAGVEPVSRQFGFDRGRPIDRHYIEHFLRAHQKAIRGRVLEVGEPQYTRRFGGERVTSSDVLHKHATRGATIVADLAECPQIADGAFDCFILTQTLPFIFDLRAALRNAWRIIAPGGTLLITVPGISQISQFDAQRWGDYWRFTPQGLQRLVAECCPEATAEFATFGNVRAASAFLDGRAFEELSETQIEHGDPDYPMIIAAALTR